MNNEEVLYAMLRTDFKPFVRKVFNTISGDTYMDNWHIDMICSEIMDMVAGRHNKLIINIPPRNMKSIICSIALPAFLLGLNPETNIICVSYNDNLAEKFASDCLRVMMQPWYMDVFPKTKLKSNRPLKTDFETTRGGGRMSTSIGGTLTGRGADWIIIDDPLKPSDAMSDTQRDKVNDWYGSTLCSRLNDKSRGKIILIMQRLHQNDLTGFLMESNVGFKLIRLPVIAEEKEIWVYRDRIRKKTVVRGRSIDKLLHPAREDMDVICDIRRAQGEFTFAGQYQQRPSPAGGNLVRESMLKYYNGEPPRLFEIIIACDTAVKIGTNNAFSAFVALGIDKDHRLIYLLDVYRERLEFPELIKRVSEFHRAINKKYNPYNGTHFLIENASSGTQLIQYLKGDNEFRYKVREAEAASDKITRFAGITPYIENGTVLFPSIAGSWWPDFKDELLNFPSTQFKDQCDAFAHGVKLGWERAKIGPFRAVVFD